MSETGISEHRPVALVTGASSGMGSAIARELAATHHVIAVGRDAVRLAAVVDLIESSGDGNGASAAAWRFDLVEDQEEIGARVAGLGRLDALVHAAAISPRRSVSEADPADWNAQFAVNVIAPAVLTRHALPLLRKARGTVVFIGSGAGTRPVPGSAIYTASKHALRAVADVLRIDEEPHRVRVATVAPGQTDTEMLRAAIPAAEYAPERYIRPESVAGTVRFVIDAPADVQLTDVAVRPRQEVARI